MNWITYVWGFANFVAGAAFARWWLLRRERRDLAAVGVISGDDARRFTEAMERNSAAARERR